MTEDRRETQGKAPNQYINQPQMLNTDKKLLNTMTGALSVTPAKAPTTPALIQEPVRTELLAHLYQPFTRTDTSYTKSSLTS